VKKILKKSNERQKIAKPDVPSAISLRLRLGEKGVMLTRKLAPELFESRTLEVANSFSSGHPLFGPMP
jgi:hypothetical protein